MKALDLQEFAEDLRRKGDIRQADLADEILSLIDIERDVAEPYEELCDDLRHYAPESLSEQPAKMLEWIGDRSDLLAEIETELKEAERTGDTDDAVKEMIATLADAESILRASGWAEGDFLDALQELANKADRAPAKQEYDL